ncbi:TolC family protein [Flavobacterium sediminilitoris]|uniref:TolC family protein n=1 Tax=Flavobacterium sediminilitoris TaxID=2024526 RepID=A0ABY4HRL7_9FLAO|nr:MULTISPECIES: TolC family protein [Flavobacterium]UOX35255.1 TolC family protein [Flavobacterium sediminilitoris]
MNKKIIVCLFFITISFFVKGQENTWSLQKCIDTALENNIEIKIRQLEIKRTQKARNSMLNEILPVVNLFGSQSYNFGSTINPSTNGRVSSNIQYDNFYLNAQMNLLDFNAIVNSKRNKISIEIAKAEKEIIENEYKLQILESYYQALFTQELLKIQKEQLKNTIFNFDRISKEVNTGSKPKSDLYDIQLNLSQEEKQVIETEQLFTIQKTQLFQLMNYSNIIIENVSLEKALTSNVETEKEINNPKIISAKLNYERDLEEVSLQRSNNLPVLSAFYQISSFYYKPLNQPDVIVDSFNNQIGNNKNQQVGLQLNIPILNGFKNNRKINVAKIESEKSNLKIEQENQKVAQQLEIEEKNKQNYLALQKKLDEVLAFAHASFITTQAKFVVGKVDTFIYSSVKNNVLTSEYNVLKNDLQLQYINFKMNLIRSNNL